MVVEQAVAAARKAARLLGLKPTGVDGAYFDEDFGGTVFLADAPGALVVIYDVEDGDLWAEVIDTDGDEVGAGLANDEDSTIFRYLLAVYADRSYR